MSDAQAAPATAPPSQSAGWLLPALLAPVVTTTLVAGLFALFRGHPGEKIEAFLALALFGVFVAGVQSAALLVVDLGAAALRLRRLPSGLRAWGAGGLAPLVAIWIAVLVPLPFDNHFFVSLFIASTAAALPIRLLIGPRWRAP